MTGPAGRGAGLLATPEGISRKAGPAWQARQEPPGGESR